MFILVFVGRGSMSIHFTTQTNDYVTTHITFIPSAMSVSFM